MRFAAALLVSSLLVAQDEPTIKVEVNVVNVLFSVHNKGGGLVGNLGKDDFKVFEDGKQQEIKYFTRETDLPLTIGLLIDVSASQGNLIGIEQDAASQFFGQVLRPKDMAFLISFGADADLLQDYTNSPKLLRAGLQDLKVNSDTSGAAMHPGPVPTVSNPRGTILYDAVYLAAADQLKGQVGRKVLVLITDGEDQGSRYKIQEAIQAAQKADAIIYSFYYVDRGFYARQGMWFGGGGESYLKRMSEETGGRVFRIDNKHPLREAFQELQDEMRSQYAVGYVPSNSTKDGSFRKLDIQANNKEYKVQARKGYYATASAE
ncbi:MAG TPA: VWA domain-containing protein [Bryobacteraceae bacterium]|nr:VWA domain-containing protein [Bryobacteraceae bacterium]